MCFPHTSEETARDSFDRTSEESSLFVGHDTIDADIVDADIILGGTGRQMCGPTGIGFLYGRQSILQTMPPWMGTAPPPSPKP